MRQPTLVLSGASDGKPLSDDGRDYEASMPNCRVLQVPGRNVLPWESTGATVDAVGQFIDGVSGAGLTWSA